MAEVCSPGSGYGYPLERALTGWFGGGAQRPTEVRFENFRELTATVMFNKPWEPTNHLDFEVGRGALTHYQVTISQPTTSTTDHLDGRDRSRRRRVCIHYPT